MQFVPRGISTNHSRPLASCFQSIALKPFILSKLHQKSYYSKLNQIIVDNNTWIIYIVYFSGGHCGKIRHYMLIPQVYKTRTAPSHWYCPYAFTCACLCVCLQSFIINKCSVVNVEMVNREKNLKSYVGVFWASLCLLRSRVRSVSSLHNVTSINRSLVNMLSLVSKTTFYFWNINYFSCLAWICNFL